MTNAEALAMGTLQLGPVSCRIDGRAGYLQLFHDRVDLIRSGRRGGVEPIAGFDINAITTTRTGRLLTTVEIEHGPANATVELKFPAADALRIVALVERIAEAAEAPAPSYHQPFAPAPAPASAPVVESTGCAPPVVESAIGELSVAPETSSIFALPPVEVPEVRMPEWTPLPEEPAELIVPEAPEASAAPELTLTLAPAVVDPAPEPTERAERLGEISEELANRLARLEVLRTCGILSEADHAMAQAELLDLGESERASA